MELKFRSLITAVFRWTTSLYKNFHWKHVDSSFQRYQSPVRLFQLLSRDICEQSSITVRSYGLIEERKSRRRWDVEELTDAIFQCDLTMVCWVSDTQEDWSAWKLARILWSCVKFQPRINGGYSILQWSNLVATQRTLCNALKNPDRYFNGIFTIPLVGFGQLLLLKSPRKLTVSNKLPFSRTYC